MNLDFDQLIAAKDVEQRLLHLLKNYLSPSGYLNPQPMDGQGLPVPWFTYPAIEFLKDIVDKNWKVLEYGSGFSSLFFNRTCGEVLSVEHSPQWAQNVRGLLPSAQVLAIKEGDPLVNQEAAAGLDAFRNYNFALPISGVRPHDIEHGLLNPEFAGYASVIFDKPAGYYDLVIVDGMARSLGLFWAAQRIKEGGWIILDNSDRWQYNALQEYLINSGFGRIDFWGLGPKNIHGWCTSFFSKNLKTTHSRINRPQGTGDLGW